MKKSYDGYEQVYTPDKAKLKELIIKAKGSGRTMAQYAEQCGVSASTLSRIANCKICAAISEDLLFKLYENQDPSSDISLVDWTRSNGMRKKTDRKLDDYRYIRMQKYKERQDRKNQIERSIMNRLADLGLTIKKSADRLIGNTKDIKFGMKTKADLRLYIPDKSMSWDFIIWPFNAELDEITGNYREFDIKRLARQLADAYSAVFLLDSWKPTILNSEKVSFVFSDVDILDEFIVCMEGATVHNDFSLILFDKEGENIIKETDLKGKIIKDSGLTSSSNSDETDDSEDFMKGQLTLFDLFDDLEF